MSAVLALVLSLAYSPVRAADEPLDALKLVTSSQPLLTTVEPGTTTTVQVKLRNGANHPENLQVEVLKFSSDGVTGKPNIAAFLPQDTWKEWLVLPQKTFTVAADATIDVPVELRIPKDAAFSYDYALAFSRAVSSTSKGDTRINGAIASLLMVDVSAPNARRELALSDFTTDKKAFTTLPVEFSVKLANTGTTHAIPTGSILLEKGGKQIAILPVNAEVGSVLPDSSRTFSVTWEDGFPVRQKDGHYKWDISKLATLRGGKYTASLVVAYDAGGQDKTLEKVLTFWVIPWPLYLAILVILALIGTGIWTAVRGIRQARKRYRKK